MFMFTFINSNLISLFANYGNLQHRLAAEFSGFGEKSVFKFVLHIFALVYTKVKT